MKLSILQLLAIACTAAVVAAAPLPARQNALALSLHGASKASALVRREDDETPRRKRGRIHRAFGNMKRKFRDAFGKLKKLAGRRYRKNKSAKAKKVEPRVEPVSEPASDSAPPAEGPAAFGDDEAFYDEVADESLDDEAFDNDDAADDEVIDDEFNEDDLADDDFENDE
ncbi:hypothetical protein DFJ73DRAFT_811218 [Zopfochytrium polystomum]|nr:hypothetical protein DFJ73DRAFT_811218 [Zopfochytrium polystomum]